MNPEQEDEDPKLIQKSQQPAKNLNLEKPPNANPIPKEILGKYGNNITDIWWNAKGRNGPDGDPTIGVEINGLRKTFSGYVWDDWWYFQKVVHKTDNPEEPNKCYWYRKKKVPDETDPKEFKTIEEYVGAKLKDLDTGIAIQVPQELRHKTETLCPSDDTDEKQESNEF